MQIEYAISAMLASMHNSGLAHDIALAIKAKFRNIVIVGAGSSAFNAGLMSSFNNNNLSILRDLSRQNFENALSKDSPCFLFITKSGITNEVRFLFDQIKQRISLNTSNCYLFAPKNSLINADDINKIDYDTSGISPRFTPFAWPFNVIFNICHQGNLHDLVRNILSSDEFIKDVRSRIAALNSEMQNVTIACYEEDLRGLLEWKKHLLAESFKNLRNLPKIFFGSAWEHSEIEAVSGKVIMYMCEERCEDDFRQLAMMHAQACFECLCSSGIDVSKASYQRSFDWLLRDALLLSVAVLCSLGLDNQPRIHNLKSLLYRKI